MITRTVLLSLTLMLNAIPEQLHIKSAVSAYEKGRVEQQQKNWDSASELFGRTIEIEPTFIEARQALIEVDLSSGKQVEAAAALTQLLEIEPGDVSQRIVLGHILQQLNQQERALAQFSAVLSTDSYNVEALLGFASAAKAVGMQDRATEALERGRKHFPSDARFKLQADTAPRQK